MPSAIVDRGATARRRAAGLFLAKQFAANFAVAVILTLVATALVFHGRAAVPLWGAGNLAVDLLPSTVLPSIGAALGITRATAAATRHGLLTPVDTVLARLLPKWDVLAGVVIGLGLLAVLGPGFVAVVGLVYGGRPVPHAAIILGKLIYAFVLCLLNTPIVVQRARQRA